MQPKLGSVSSQWIEQDGEPVLILQHALRLAPSAIALPQALAVLPFFCDGTRDVSGLRASLQVRAGVRVSEEVLARVIAQMDEALLFENARERRARFLALEAYRAAEARMPVSAGSSYPIDGDEATRFLDELVERAGVSEAPAELPGAPPAMRAIVSPHIDYQRGWRTYAHTWDVAREAVAGADLVVLLGTDHQGPAGSITLTRQHYLTPWGTLETDSTAVDCLEAAVGAESAFAHELHHTVEHSIELAAVWLRYVAGNGSLRILPVLCGSFAPFVEEDEPIDAHAGIAQTIEALQELSAGARRVLYVAAVDFAHLGPAFEGMPVTQVERATCRVADEGLLRTISAGDGPAFLAQIRAEKNQRNVCGVPPLHFLLRVLDGARGVMPEYEQCPADEQGTSIVSIAGGWLW